MCIIIHRPKGVVLSKAIYEECFWRNEDGAGFVYAKADGLHVVKGLMKFEEFYEALLPFEKEELVIHFRNASPGMKVSPEMTHPFGADSGGTFDTDDGKAQYTFQIVHNGKLPWRDTKVESDTYLFVKELLGPHLNRDPYFLDDSGGRCFLGMAAGFENKFCVMRWDAVEKKSKVYIVNPEGGYGDKKAHFALGCWFSNNSYLKSTRPIVYTGRGWGGIDGFYGSEFDTEGVNVIGAGSAASSARTFRDKDWTDTGFGKPDDNGWYWSYDRDCWRNKTTGTCAETLKTRPERPQYIIDREKNAAARNTGAAHSPAGDDEVQVPESSYLTKKEKKRLLKLAEDFCYAHGMTEEEMGYLPQSHMFSYLRIQVSEFFEETHTMDKKSTDHWILKNLTKVEKLCQSTTIRRPDPDSGMLEGGTGVERPPMLQSQGDTI